jgi:hypothetical protein
MHDDYGNALELGQLDLGTPLALALLLAAREHR